MTRQLVDERPTTVDPQAARRRSGDRRPMEWADLWNAFPSGTWVAAAAAVRGALVALSGMVVTVSLAIVIWAITPQSGDDASAALHAGFAALAAANLLPLSIGGVWFTLPPLLLTVLMGVLLGSSARRGRLLPAGRAQECLVTLVGGGVYGLLVLMVTRGLGPDGVVAPGVGPLAVGVLGYGIGTLARNSAWRSWWRSVVPHWLAVAARAATVGSLALVAGAATLFAISLGLHFGAALTVAAAVAPGGLDGAGLALLQLVYLPNAVLAAVGFSTGAGVQVGPGSYLPWGSSAAELPGVPFLAALPTGAGPSAVTAVLLVPVLAAGLLGWTVMRGGLAARRDRVLAAGVASVVSAVVLGVAVFAAGGGVGDGRWAVIGAPALLVAAAVAVFFGVLGAAIAGLIDHRTVPWRAAPATARTATRRPRKSARAAVRQVGGVDTGDAADDATSAEVDRADAADGEAVDGDQLDQNAADENADRAVDDTAPARAAAEDPDAVDSDDDQAERSGIDAGRVEPDRAEPRRVEPDGAEPGADGGSDLHTPSSEPGGAPDEDAAAGDVTSTDTGAIHTAVVGTAAVADTDVDTAMVDPTVADTALAATAGAGPTTQPVAGGSAPVSRAASSPGPDRGAARSPDLDRGAVSSPDSDRGAPGD